MKNLFKYNLQLSLVFLIMVFAAIGFSGGIAAVANAPVKSNTAQVSPNIHLAQNEMGDGQETHGKNT